MKEESQIVIKFDNLQFLVEGGKEIAINPRGEELLIRLYELKDKVEFAIQQCKNKIQVAIEEIDPDLTSISSDNVKVMYRVYGVKYGLNQMLIDELDPKFYKQKISYSPNTKEIENEIKLTGALPNGIEIKDRSKTVSISLKNKK